MLKECLESILIQKFSDYEVLVGNDYTKDTLSGNQFGIDDTRIKFFNYLENLGEVSNMNTLLSMSRGKYFTWLADDDMYFPNFLESVYESLVLSGFLPCVFTSYLTGNYYPKGLKIQNTSGQIVKGKHFLHMYLERSFKLQGCYGVFEKKYLVEIGGIKKLGIGFGPYSDNRLAIKAGLLKNVIYINAPLIFYRSHDESISQVNPDVDAYSSAQAELISESVEIFRNDGLHRDFCSNLYLLLKWCFSDYCTVMYRSGSIQVRKLMRYLLFLIKYVKLLGKYRYKLVVMLIKQISILIYDHLKRRLAHTCQRIHLQ